MLFYSKRPASYLLNHIISHIVYFIQALRASEARASSNWLLFQKPRHCNRPSNKKINNLFECLFCKKFEAKKERKLLEASLLAVATKAYQLLDIRHSNCHLNCHLAEKSILKLKNQNLYIYERFWKIPAFIWYLPI